VHRSWSYADKKYRFGAEGSSQAQKQESPTKARGLWWRVSKGSLKRRARGIRTLGDCRPSEKSSYSDGTSEGKAYSIINESIFGRFGYSLQSSGYSNEHNYEVMTL
jgi:hypothetical protein